MQADKTIKTENDVKIFCQPKRLIERADRGGDGNSFGSKPITHFLDSSALLQEQSDVAVNILDPLKTIQRILLKEGIPKEAFHMGNG